MAGMTCRLWGVGPWGVPAVCRVVLACSLPTLVACDDAPASAKSTPAPAVPGPNPSPSPTPTAPPPSKLASRQKVKTFTTPNYFTYGAAIQRHERTTEEGRCRPATLWLANGNDHIPQHVTRFEVPNFAVRGSCSVGSTASGWSSRAMYFADVATGDIDGVAGDDEVFLAALSDRDGDARTGGVWRGLDSGEIEEVHLGFGAAALALGDVDGSGKLDLVVGTLGVPTKKFEVQSVDCGPPTTAVMDDRPAAPDDMLRYKSRQTLSLPPGLLVLPDAPREPLPAWAHVLGFPFGGSAADGTYGDESGGESTDGDATDGEATDGDESGGDESDGDESGGDDTGEDNKSTRHERIPIRAAAKNAKGSAVLVYLDVGRGGAGRPLALAADGGVDIDLHDVDHDGALDIVVGGADVRVFYGPITRDKPVRWVRLPWAKSNPNVAALGVDVADVVGADGRVTHTWIAASRGCLNATSCSDSVADMGVTVWRRDAAADGCKTPEKWARRDLETNGLPSAVRFTDRDDDGIPDLLVGRMTEHTDWLDDWCGPELGSRMRIPGLGLMGAPLLAFAGARDGAAGPWLKSESETITLHPGPVREIFKEFFPMAFRIIAYADVRDAKVRCSDEKFRDQFCRFNAPRCGALGVGSVLTYRGPGAIAGVDSVKDEAGSIQYHHIDGEAFITLAQRARGTVTVDWRVTPSPAHFITSTSPIPGPSGSSLFIEPPKLKKPTTQKKEPEENDMEHRQ